MKKAVIVGSQGQDGQLLWQLLVEKNYSIVGIDHEHIQCHQTETLPSLSITQAHEVEKLIKNYQPDEIYFLAAIHASGQEKQQEDLAAIQQTYEVNAFSLMYFLQAMQDHQKNADSFMPHPLTCLPRKIWKQEVPSVWMSIVLLSPTMSTE